MNLFYRLSLFVLAIGLAVPVWSQESEESDSEEKKEQTKKKKSPFKDYDEIITEEAMTDEGLFTVHMLDDKLYYEIPFGKLNRELLLITRLVQLPTGLGGGYTNAGSKIHEQVVRWQRKGKKILLRKVSYNSVADESLPISKSVKYNNFEPIIEAFDIKTFNEDSTSLVIDVTGLFTSDVKAISGLSGRNRSRYKVSRLDGSRSMIDTVKAFPINVEVIHTMTYNASQPPSNSNVNAISMQVNQSMIELPEDPMTPRLYDERVGWFTTSQYDYGSNALKSDRKTYIRRWRLEPKDPAAYARGELVEPVKPIVYYLDPATPEKWRPYFRQGIQDWNAAFEKAGFKNAIIAKDPPTPEEDSEFSPEDARYSTVRYVATTTRNAVGPSVSDPRTGEILESDIIWYHNHLRSYRNRFLLETGAANPKARSLDTPEEEIGEMMRRVISHEIGHALGLPHNMKSSSAYPVDSLRSGTFTQKYGIATTIMDYARYNYVAQPEDENIRFIRQLGPYDMYSIEWGYRYIPSVEKPEDELETTRSWIEAHEGDSMYMFGSRGNIDPRSQTECVGDDNVKASEYGITNLKRVVPNLIEWTSTQGENYDDLQELYGELLGVWRRYLNHVVTNVGGVYETLKTYGQEGAVHEHVPTAVQKEAMAFLQDHAFETPYWLMDKEILMRITSAGALDRLRGVQVSILNNLMDMGRMQRLIEAETFNGSAAYGLMDMCKDLRQGLWSELTNGSNIDVGRRNLQRAYLERMEYMLNNEQGVSYGNTQVDVSQSDIRAVVKAEMKALKKSIESALKKTKDEMTKVHLEDCLDRIDAAMDA